MIYAHWRVFAREIPFIRNTGIQIYFQMKGHGPDVPHWMMTFKEVEFKKEDEESTYDDLSIEPLEIPEDAAQQLMDQLWKCGLRPSEGTGSAGSLKATQDHLRDIKDHCNRMIALVERAWGIAK